MKKKKQRMLNCLLILFFIAATVCGLLIWSDHKGSAAADAAIDEAQDLKPPADDGLMDFSGLRSENPDVVAWLTIPGTVIDYPVAQAADNDYYLHRDIQKTSNKNGALFLDCRVRADFSGFNNVVYGHHMKSGRMFQNLVQFKDKAFFDRRTSGILHTPGKTWRLEFFAVAVTCQNSEWYEYAFASIGEKEAHIQKIKNSAMHYRDIGLATDDRLVVLSTCSYEHEGARTVVAARLEDYLKEPSSHLAQICVALRPNTE